MPCGIGIWGPCVVCGGLEWRHRGWCWCRIWQQGLGDRLAGEGAGHVHEGNKSRPSCARARRQTEIGDVRVVCEVATSGAASMSERGAAMRMGAEIPNVSTEMVRESNSVFIRLSVGAVGINGGVTDRRAVAAMRRRAIGRLREVEDGGRCWVLEGLYNKKKC